MRANLHLLGIQGSGKGTQAARLVERYRLCYLGSGNLLRLRATVDDALGRELADEMKHGQLVPDRFLVETVRQHLSAQASLSGIVGDGVIRTLSQDQLLQAVWKEHHLDQPLLIQLDLDEATAESRIKQRREEAVRGVNLEHHQTYSGKLLKRTDDTARALEERFRLYRTMTEPIVTEFAERERLITISAAQSIEDVFNAITEAVEQFYPELTPHVVA